MLFLSVPLNLRNLSPSILNKHHILQIITYLVMPLNSFHVSQNIIQMNYKTLNTRYAFHSSTIWNEKEKNIGLLCQSLYLVFSYRWEPTQY